MQLPVKDHGCGNQFLCHHFEELDETIRDKLEAANNLGFLN